jgi:predicted nucleic acid-binding protein
MTVLRFLDTNILLYSVSRDPTETTKHDRAVALVDAGNNALSVQVLQEFYVPATRPNRPDPLSHDIAAGLIRTWLRFKVQEISVPIMTGALEIRAAQCYLIGTSPSWPLPARSGVRNWFPKT